MSSIRTRSHDGRILLSENSDGTNQVFIYPGESGFDTAMQEFNRRNSIPPIPPTGAPHGDDIQQQNNDINIANQEHENNDEEGLPISDALLLRARRSFKTSTRAHLKDKCLEILYTQGEDIDTSAPRVRALNLTQLEIDECVTKYIANPVQTKETSSVSGIQLYEGVVRLGKYIARDAKAFQAWSDKMANQHVDLHLCVDRDAIFTIDTTLQAQKEHLSLSDHERENWLTLWSHSTLAKWISTIWSDKNSTGTKNLENQVREFDFEFNQPRMKLGNIEGEQGIFNAFNEIFHQHNIETYNKEDVQKRLIKSLDKKLPEGWQKADMASTSLPKTTVREWLIALKTSRLNALRCIEMAQ